MSDFRKFDHVERSGKREVDGILDGVVHVFPKLDGTNGSVWAEQTSSVVGGGTFKVMAGSRNRVLSVNNDNHGFASYVWGDSDTAEKLRDYVVANPSLILYGEWLIPNTIKGYKDAAWRRFYVFDVYSRSRECYMSYDNYANQLHEAGIDYIPAIALDKPSMSELDDYAATLTYLMNPGQFGEGIVVKRYDWSNMFKRQPWLKVLRPGFATNRAPKPAVTEDAIAAELVDGHLVEKEYAKGILRLAESLKVTFPEVGGFKDVLSSVVDEFRDAFVEEHRSKVIGILLAQVFNDVIDDRLTARELKKFGYPTVNFRTLRAAVTRRVKELKPDLF